MDVVVFHHAVGLTNGVVAFADVLRSAGHSVHTPDLFDGRSFESIEAGVAHAEEVGFSEIIRRGARAFDERRGPRAVCGFSLGVLPAQMLSQTRSGDVKCAVLIDACLPLTEFGPSWPAAVPVQIHGMDADPFFVGDGDIGHARVIVGSDTRDQGEIDAELFLYRGDQHLFADRSLTACVPDAADRLEERVFRFLERID